MAAYYNEIDEFAAAWLRELIREGLIADGEVDTRSIVDVRPDDVRGFTQCHFFAGIGGWSYALRLAGWHDDVRVWTGSTPCLPHSSAARGRRVAPDLWPPFGQLIAASRPDVVFGEQVAVARSWIDRVCDDMEALDYAFAAAVLPACSVGFDHARQRIFFVGHANGNRESVMSIDGEVDRMSRNRREPAIMVSQNGLPGRVARMRGFGNAIVPPLAAEFVMAYMEATAAEREAGA